MKYNVSSILKVIGASLPVSGKVELTEKKLSPSGPEFRDDVYFEGEITNIGDRLELVGKITGSFTVWCARCAKEIAENADIDFTEHLANNVSDSTDPDEIILFEGDVLDLSELVESNLLIHLSFKYLCSEDCKGLCPTCGADFNVASCSCVDDRIDPRLAGLKKLLEEQ